MGTMEWNMKNKHKGNIFNFLLKIKSVQINEIPMIKQLLKPCWYSSTVNLMPVLHELQKAIQNKIKYEKKTVHSKIK